MKKYLFAAILLIGTVSLHAQTLTPAKKIPPKLTKEATINASYDELWNLISVLDKVADYNSEIVKSVEKEGDGYEAYRLCKLFDGSERGEEVVVFTKEHGRICFSSEDSQYPVDRFVVNYYFKKQGKEKSKLRLEAYFNVKSGAPKTKTYKAIAKELAATVKGVQNYFLKKK